MESAGRVFQGKGVFVPVGHIANPIGMRSFNDFGKLKRKERKKKEERRKKERMEGDKQNGKQNP